MPKIESEKIDCLYRPCSRPAPRGKIESVRTHSEVIEQFDSFSLLKLLFLVRNWHCWLRKAFPCKMTPQSREKTAKTAVFRHRWQAWKVVRSIGAVRQRPRTPRNWRCSFAFFEIFLWHFNKKQRADHLWVIFRLFYWSVVLLPKYSRHTQFCLLTTSVNNNNNNRTTSACAVWSVSHWCVLQVRRLRMCTG